MVDLRDSTMYQLILEEGGVSALQKVLLLQGGKRFGPPNAAQEQTLRAIDDIERLERMSERLLDVTTWQELLATP